MTFMEVSLKYMNKADKNDVGRVAAKIAVKTASLTVDTASVAVSTILKTICTVLLVFVITGLLFVTIFAYYVKTCLSPNVDITLEDYKLNESSTIWVQNNAGQWDKLDTLSGKENRIWVDYDEIPWYMEKALVAIEDKRFYDHKGVDWYRTSGAFIKMFATMQNSFGGSTITQQLIKNVTGQDDITVQRKLAEIFGALELEKKYDKKEIIEWYLNAVYFGEGCWGVQTAAQTYFGKNVSDLTLAECAAIVGITNQPTAFDPFYSESANKERQETILREMYDQGYIDYGTYIDAVNEQLVFAHSADEGYVEKILSYYEETVISDVRQDLMAQKNISYEAATHLIYNSGYQIYCCLDTDIQAKVDSVYTDITQIPATWNSSQQLQSAIVIMDPYDGTIKAICGGVGEKTRNWGFDRATLAKRSAGSAIKPLASYGPAVDLGYLTPATLVNDGEDIYLSGTSWYPSNDSGGHMGIITIYEALQYSLNTVAAQIVDKIGVNTSYDYLTNHLGFTSLVAADCDYAPMALGQFTNGITVREMCQAYCSFVNSGTFTYSRSYYYVTDSDGNVILNNEPKTIQAFKENTAYVMTYMMQNAVESGTGYEAALWGKMPVAGKTGTTTDSKDRYFVGCTPYYVAAIWCGYDTPEVIRMSYVNNPAASLYKKVMGPVHEGLEYKNFTWPYLGGDTGLFGDLQAELDRQEEEEKLAEEEAAAAEAAAAEAAAAEAAAAENAG